MSLPFESGRSSTELGELSLDEDFDQHRASEVRL